MVVSQYAFFSDLVSLCSHYMSSLTVEVQFQFSKTQVHKTHGSARCVLDNIEDASSADLREIPEDAAVAVYGNLQYLNSLSQILDGSFK